MSDRESSSPSSLAASFSLLAAAVTLLLAIPASAVSIALSGPDGPVVVGNPFSIQIGITGLGAGTTPTLSGFELAVTYDAALAGVTGVSFGSGLGLVGSDPLVTSSGLLGGPTRVAALEASFLSSAVLDAGQPGAFVLVTIGFTALAPGVAQFDLRDVVLADTSSTPGGNEIVPDGLSGTSVMLLAVPEPASATLLGVGAALVSFGPFSAARRTSRRRRNRSR